MSYGTDETGGFNDASWAYKKEPTLQNYAQLRRNDPTAEIEVSVHGGFDSVLALQSEFEAHGISVEQMVAVLDADQSAISQVSLRLIDVLIQHEELSRRGETHLVRRDKVMPLKLVDWIIAISLEALSWTNSMEMNRDLLVLVNARLIGKDPHYSKQVATHELRRSAIWIGGQLIATGQGLSIRKVASTLNVAPSTVSRWFSVDDFEQECNKLSVLFNPDGSLKNAFHEDSVKTNKDTD